MFETAIFLFIAGLTTFTTIYTIRKVNGFEQNLEENLIDILENQEVQKRLYMLGGIIGNGFKQGMGLDALKPKKMKMEDILMQLIAGYAQQYMPKIIGQEAEQTLDIELGKV
ncbi:hypothetical protein DRO69_09830 [Candidatus Bathyarchaeota archaeon]|nr:MAG: hypothetical protein DRO69_09830 [Candidatus Bathyarchaeota archaeon]